MSKKNIGHITLRGGHTLILGNIPEVIDVNKLEEANVLGSNVDIEKFGLFETSSPNYTTYYPDVKPEDLQPKDEDFIQPVFRMLSEVIVSKGRPIDFSMNNVLRKSMNKLIGQTINVDHETATGNAIGSVSEVFWQPAYTAKDGTKVPAGINAKLKIDGKSNPRLARGIMMNPPSIHSNSVSVKFSWVPSHKFESMDEFYNKLGTYTDKGELVRCVADEIISYSETSLVPHGADPFAQKVDENGEIVNTKYATSSYQFSAEKPINASFAFDFKDFENEGNEVAILSLSNNNNNTNPNKKDLMNIEELIQNLVSDFKFESDTSSENLAERLVKALGDNNQEITNLTAEKGKLQKEKEDLEASVQTLTDSNTELEEGRDQITKLTESTRQEALRFYKASKGENTDESIISLISGADLKTAGALLKQYRTDADGKFSATCKKCGSNEVTRNSGIPSKEGLVDDDTDGGNEFTPKSTTETKASLQSKHKKQSRIFNKDK